MYLKNKNLLVLKLCLFESQYTGKKICGKKNNSRKRDYSPKALEAASEKKTPKRTSGRKKDGSEESRKILNEIDDTKNDGTDIGSPHLVSMMSI